MVKESSLWHALRSRANPFSPKRIGVFSHAPTRSHLRGCHAALHHKRFKIQTIHNFALNLVDDPTQHKKNCLNLEDDPTQYVTLLRCTGDAFTPSKTDLTKHFSLLFVRCVTVYRVRG